jgi:hypothetical protein
MALHSEVRLVVPARDNDRDGPKAIDDRAHLEREELTKARDVEPSARSLLNFDAALVGWLSRLRVGGARCRCEAAERRDERSRGARPISRVHDGSTLAVDQTLHGAPVDPARVGGEVTLGEQPRSGSVPRTRPGSGPFGQCVFPKRASGGACYARPERANGVRIRSARALDASEHELRQGDACIVGILLQKLAQSARRTIEIARCSSAIRLPEENQWRCHLPLPFVWLRCGSACLGRQR